MNFLLSIALIVITACSSQNTLVPIPSKFDQPIYSQRKALLPDPLNPQDQRFVECLTYPAAVLKTVYEGGKGSARLAILPTIEKKPACTQEIEDGEKVIKDWKGSFLGVKGGYAFVIADDLTVEGGMPFMVLRLKDNQVVFTDKAKSIETQKIDFTSETLTLKYDRVYSAGCSVMQSPKACIEKIIHATGVAGDFLEKCQKSYAFEIQGIVNFRCKESKDPKCVQEQLPTVLEDTNNSPSVIIYQVEASIPQASTGHIERKSDVMKCYPAQ